MTQDEFRTALANAGLNPTNCYVRLNYDRTAIDRIRLRGVEAYIEWRPRLQVWDVIMPNAKTIGHRVFPKLVARELDLGRAVEFAKTATIHTKELDLKSMAEYGTTQEQFIASRDDSAKPYNSRPAFNDQYILK